MFIVWSVKKCFIILIYVCVEGGGGGVVGERVVGLMEGSPRNLGLELYRNHEKKVCWETGTWEKEETANLL